MHPTDVRRLLFIRPRFLGDLCLTLPLVQAARAACPDARVAYVCERGLAPLLADDPCIGGAGHGHDGAHERVGFDRSPTAAGQGDGPSHQELVARTRSRLPL